MHSPIAGKKVVLAVSGGIAAYKAAELTRLLVKAGAEVRVLMTKAAQAFVTPLTFQALSGHEVTTDLFAPGMEGGIGHIALADQADLIIVAPATANLLARMNAGMADDLVTAVLLATRAPILVAPAMNTNMWEHPITQANLANLRKLPQLRVVGPAAGDLACGWVGAGRMSEPPEILQAAEGLLAPGDRTLPGQGPLAGKHVVVTAGPTWEPVDDVRFLGNRSSGKMGFAVAAKAAERGAQVTLIAGPVALATPPGIAARVDVESALEMREALHKVLPTVDVVVMSAAVADFRPGVRVLGKLSRRDPGLAPKAKSRSLSLVANPDLLAELGKTRARKGPFLVGFAAEVGVTRTELIRRARGKLAEKGCDVVVANEVGKAGLGFGAEANAVTLVFADGRVMDLPPNHKDVIANGIWDCIAPGIGETRAVNVPGLDREADHKNKRKKKHA
jgi:phosphopantothenoylcysteine decarboxylase/phosphopantothenate--cysteine ligase